MCVSHRIFLRVVVVVIGVDSVTMPIKTAVIPYLDALTQKLPNRRCKHDRESVHWSPNQVSWHKY